MTLPADFERLMCEQWGQTRARQLFHALTSTEAATAVRLNPLRSLQDTTIPLADGSVPWCPGAFYLRERPPFTFDPLLHAGAYYVQDASSMFLAAVLSRHLTSVTCALDLCAAPGGKSTLLRSLLPSTALLVSNEPMRQRAQILSENLTKWGHPSVMVTQNMPADFAPLPEMFDLVVADVPCSGEGMFRKDPDAIGEWSLQNVELCQRRQRQIILDIWPSLRPGGLLVYSTCTFNSFENEQNLEWMVTELDAEVVETEIDEGWGIEGRYHLLPGHVRGEGQYMAAVRKKSTTLRSPSHHVAKPVAPRCDARRTTVRFPQWLSGEFEFFTEDDACIAFPAAHSQLRRTLSRSLNVVSQGVRVAEMRGRDWQPAHALAMSASLVRSAFPQVELTPDQALQYLRREAISITAPRGIVLVTYGSLPLGFVKNLGPRANNLYPQEWRIRSGHSQRFSLFASLPQ